MEKYDIDYEKGCVEVGDPSYIINVLKRARKGEKLTIGFLGGSITQDAVTSDHKYCYAYRVYDWFVKTFPQSEFTYVNAGIGATDSEFAAARVKEQLLAYKPDFVLMEHAVNDESTEHFKETYEGVTRQILKSDPGIALLQMCNVFYNDGASAELMHRRISRYYGIPVVSMRTTIYEALLQGRFDNRQITQDDLHPNDEGHGLVARVITTYLQALVNGIEAEASADSRSNSAKAGHCKETTGTSYAVSEDNASGDRHTVSKDYIEKVHIRCSGELQERVIPEPYTQNRYEDSVKYDNRNSEGSGVLKNMQGFTADLTPQLQVRDCFRNGYSATVKGSFAEYEVEGSCIAVQFRRTIKLPAPVARCVVDGDEENAVILDANFDETWGDKLVLTDVYMSDRPAKHKVRIELIEDHPDDKGDFYLAGLIVSGN